MTDTETQSKHCDMSRNTTKAPKILKNLGEACRHFPIDEPILCVGCGDGLEIDVWKLLGFKDVSGIDTDKKKIQIAKSYECKVDCISVYDYVHYQKRNIYCSHTLEHCEDIAFALEKLSKIALSTVCIIVPIEKNGTKNPAHLSPIRSVSDLKIENMKIVRMYENYNYELQGIVVWKRG